MCFYLDVQLKSRKHCQLNYSNASYPTEDEQVKFIHWIQVASVLQEESEMLNFFYILFCDFQQSTTFYIFIDSHWVLVAKCKQKELAPSF